MKYEDCIIQIRKIAMVFYRFYYKTYRDNALDYEDLVQEASIVVYEILNSNKYKNKSDKELVSLLNSVIKRRLNVLRRQSKRQREIYQEKFVPLEIVDNEKTLTSNINCNFDLEELRKYLTEFEYAIFYYIFVEGCVIREIPSKLKKDGITTKNYTYQYIHKKYQKAKKKLKKALKQYYNE